MQNLPMTIKMMYDGRSKEAPYVAYNPELDVSSCGKTEEKARKNLHEAVEIVLEEAEKKGKLNQLLEEAGFEKEKKNWKSPRIIFEPFRFPAVN
ncbi:hypothetical protein A2803_03225 [Candidatus Woesebacteria bacterium RIFCSPHIGHO2_01_FULL_44_21]|uniref:HicB-like antitoxin of toxin-antitoxin system domain-containing protein n=1 Tax=Candidatus Woesebacteria bacterium RIFCSPHIGHO2_01_FULL_44_21 TaxID=1802503 RepID=A0A1F7YYN0_9BACT|nr:MAG: hypothetical protein A2803_03225 [Candidatus Woesebacteria bacterium RIFCSPHIGHO2_01_FULL_44_21]OGM69154.1 MAG: hypothetical protein A2897_05015 [Candidatus Woesebacteria bacterium RIFCSPLOWO2_01_FULL_44_24b]